MAWHGPDGLESQEGADTVRRLPAGGAVTRGKAPRRRSPGKTAAGTVSVEDTTAPPGRITPRPGGRTNAPITAFKPPHFYVYSRDTNTPVRGAPVGRVNLSLGE
ncbi:hypothetical protein GCM10009099_28530 [Caenispirillum bisanense]